MNSQERIYEAISKNDLNQVREILHDEPAMAIQPIGLGGRTILHDVAEEGNNAVIKVLIEHGANINSKAGGSTPLHAAIMEAPISTIELLLRLGANPKATTDKGETPIFLAAVRRHLVDEDDEQVVTDILLKHGATLDICSAVCLGRTNELARLLAEIGESPLTGPNAAMALRFAILMHSKLILQLLLEHNIDLSFANIEDSILFKTLVTNIWDLKIIDLLLNNMLIQKCLSKKDLLTLINYAFEKKQNTVATLFESFFNNMH